MNILDSLKNAASDIQKIKPQTSEESAEASVIRLRDARAKRKRREERNRRQALLDPHHKIILVDERD